MASKLRRFLGFPYPAEYEPGYNQSLMKSMHKPLLIAVVATLIFVSWLVGICVLAPETLGPARYVRGLTLIHVVFMLFTLLVLLFAVAFRRWLYLHPRAHVAFCNLYAGGVCLWASVLSAYASRSAAVYTAFVAVTLCVAMVSLFKPWLAAVVFTANFCLYYLLLHGPFAALNDETTARMYTAGLAAILGTVIATAFYRFRTRTYYDRQIIARQMEEIHQINHQLQQLVHIDNLTGLFNRRFYDERLAGELARMNAEGDVCCLMLDIDYFKRYNDEYGHPAGDECLRAVARIIGKNAAALSGATVRYGGEEFLVAARVASATHALEAARAICRAVEDAAMPHSASPFGRVTVSCGLAHCPQGGHCPLGALTRRADEALYCSKQNGRNRATLYSGVEAEMCPGPGPDAAKAR